MQSRCSASANKVLTYGQMPARPTFLKISTCSYVSRLLISPYRRVLPLQHSRLYTTAVRAESNGGDGSPKQFDRLRTFIKRLPSLNTSSSASINSSDGASSPVASTLNRPSRPRPQYDEWGTGWVEDWDPAENLDEQDLEQLAEKAESDLRKQKGTDTPRDKWITPLLDFQAVAGAVDPDQERTEEKIQTEALANKDESQTAIRYAFQLVAIPLVSGFVVSRALADPILNFTLQNNEDAFAMTERQMVEGAQKVHIEDSRVRFDVAIGKSPPLSEEEVKEHLTEYAEEIEEEERHHNEQTLITVVSDSISGITLFTLLAQQSRGRVALFNTLSRLFEGLSDIAKAVMIILIADTLLGYHSEEGWTGLIELVLGHYGLEAEEEGVVIFVGVIPVVIDVFFKYWIFIGLNKISPGAVVTIKQIDTH